MDYDSANVILISVLALDIHDNVECKCGYRAEADWFAAEKWVREHPELMNCVCFRSWPPDFTSEDFTKKYGDRLYRLAFVPFVHADRHRIAPHCGLQEGVILE